jgi:hypothetical protein
MLEFRKFLFKNFARSTLVAAVSAPDTVFSLVGGSGALFPSPSTASYPDSIFSLVVFDDAGNFEVCYCTGRSGDSLTVERGVEGTVARAFPAGAVVVHTVTKGFLDQLSGVAPAPSTVVLSGSFGGTSFELSWTAATPATDDIILRYEIYRRVNAGAYSLLAEVDGDVTGYLDDSIDALNNSYDWYVVPVGLFGGDGPASNVVNQPQVSFLPPSAPVLTGTRNGGDYDLSWTVATPGSGDTLASYKVYRRVNGGPYTLLATVTAPATTYTDTTVDLDENSYNWYVRAVGTLAGEGPSSNIVGWGDLTYVDSVCINTNPTSNVTISPPIGAEEGDFLLWCLLIKKGNATILPAGWTPLNQRNGNNDSTHGDRSSSLSNNYELLYAYRFLAAGDTTWTLTITDTAAYLISCIHAFRGVRVSRPIGQIVPTINPRVSAAVNLDSGAFVATPYMGNLAPGGKFVFVSSVIRNDSTNPIGTLQMVGDTPDFLEGHNRTPPTGAARYGLVTAIVTPEQNELQNLVPYNHRNLASLSSTAMVVTDNAATNNPSSLNPTETANSRHEVYFDVTLTGGQVYTLAGAFCEPGAFSYSYMRVTNVPSGGSFTAGMVFDSGSTGRWKTADLGSGLSNASFSNGAFPGSIASGSTVSGTFTPPSTGTYRVAFGSTNSSTSDISPAATPLHANTLGGWLGLYEGEFLPALSRGQIRTGGSAVTSAVGVGRRRINGVNFTNNALGCAFELIPVGQIAEPARVSGGDYLGFSETAGGLTVGPPVFNVSPATGFPLHVVHPAYGPNKYYFEATVAASPFETTSGERTFIGVCTAHQTNGVGGSGVLFGAFMQNRVGTYTYGDKGTVYADGSVYTTSAPTFTAGDTVCVGIDFAANEVKFWKIVSGLRVLVDTVPIGSLYQNIPLRSLIMASSLDSTERVVTVNFTGPFIDQPAGYSAYDWENEVS